MWSKIFLIAKWITAEENNDDMTEEKATDAQNETNEVSEKN